MRLDADFEYLVKRGGPFHTVLRCDFIQSKFHEFRSCFLNFSEATLAVFLADFFERGVPFHFGFVGNHRIAEKRRVDVVGVVLVFLEKIDQAKFGGSPYGRFEAFPNDLAADFDLAIVIAIAHVLEQMQHFGKRTPFAISGEGILSFEVAGLGAMGCLHGSKTWDSKLKF
jgi:hypothetical protein